MNRVIIASCNIEIEKQKFYHFKNPILLEDVDIDNILRSSMISSNEKKNYKYFINYNDDDDDYVIKPLPIMLTNTSAYVKIYDGETKWMKFLLKMISCIKNMTFRIETVAVSKKNLIVNPCTMKSFFENQN